MANLQTGKQTKQQFKTKILAQKIPPPHSFHRHKTYQHMNKNSINL